jgi:hypothetical protein
MARIWQLDEAPRADSEVWQSSRTAADVIPAEGRLSRTAAQGRAPRGANGGRRVAMRYFVAELISLNAVLI